MESGIILQRQTYKINYYQMLFNLRYETKEHKDVLYKNYLIWYTMSEIKGVDNYENLKQLFICLSKQFKYKMLWLEQCFYLYVSNPVYIEMFCFLSSCLFGGDQQTVA